MICFINNISKKKTLIIFASLAVLLSLVFIVFSFIYPASVFADTKIHNQKIEFSQELCSINGQDMDKSYSYILEPTNESYPLPIDSSSGKYVVNINGSETITVQIPLTHAGVFSYRSYPVDFVEKEYYSYDKTVFDIFVYVRNTEDGGLESNIVVKRDGSEDKLESICWRHVYDEPIPLIPPVDDNGSNQSLSDSNPFADFVQTLDITYFLSFMIVLLATISCVFITIDRVRKHK